MKRSSSHVFALALLLGATGAVFGLILGYVVGELVAAVLCSLEKEPEC